MISDFLKPPTDNLYKFLTIAGLLLMLFSATYPFWLVNKAVLAYYDNSKDAELLADDLDDEEKQQKQLRQDFEVESRDQAEVNRRLSEIKSSSSSHMSRGQIRAGQKQLSEVDDLLKKLGPQAQKLSEVAHAQAEVASAIHKKAIELKFKARAAVWQIRVAIVLSIACLVGLIGGGLLTIRGFGLWSRRVQIYEDAILKKRAEEEPDPPSGK